MRRGIFKPHGGRLLFHSGEMSDDEKIKTLRTKPNFLNSMPSLKKLYEKTQYRQKGQFLHNQ